MGSPATVIELEMGDNDAVALFGPGTCRSAATVAARPRRRKAGCHVTVQHGADAVARRRTPRRRPGLQPHACHRRGGQRRRALRHEPDGPRHVPRARVYILMTLAARSERPRRRRATFGRPRGLARAAAKLRQPSRRAQDEPVFISKLIDVAPVGRYTHKAEAALSTKTTMCAATWRCSRRTPGVRSTPCRATRTCRA
mmetsp:Transcript_4272/g.10390  ORF Transcript_4272/g.10390 Transcript_4272/m.10390 type:complete len:198 (+) Transcript_4272:754-1347(+)